MKAKLAYLIDEGFGEEDWVFYEEADAPEYKMRNNVKRIVYFEV